MKRHPAGTDGQRFVFQESFRAPAIFSRVSAILALGVTALFLPPLAATADDEAFWPLSSLSSVIVLHSMVSQFPRRSFAISAMVTWLTLEDLGPGRCKSSDRQQSLLRRHQAKRQLDQPEESYVE